MSIPTLAHTPPETVPTVVHVNVPTCHACHTFNPRAGHVPSTVYAEVRTDDPSKRGPVFALCQRHFFQYGRPLGLPGSKGAVIVVKRQYMDANRRIVDTLPEGAVIAPWGSHPMAYLPVGADGEPVQLVQR